MLAICVIQVAVWRRAMASWRGQRLQDLHAEARLSWYAHLVSYAAALLGLLACMAASAEAGWTAAAAQLLALTLLLILAARSSPVSSSCAPAGRPERCLPICAESSPEVRPATSLRLPTLTHRALRPDQAAWSELQAAFVSDWARNYEAETRLPSSTGTTKR